MSDFLGHGSGLDGAFSILADGEGAMVLHEDGRGLRVLLEGLDDTLADRLGADQTERATGTGPPNSSPIIVRPHGMF